MEKDLSNELADQVSLETVRRVNFITGLLTGNFSDTCKNVVYELRVGGKTAKVLIDNEGNLRPYNPQF